MNTIKRFLTKIFFKMDKAQKLQLLMLVYAHYGNFKLEDSEDILRVQRVIEEIDIIVDEDLLPAKEKPTEKKAEPEKKPTAPAAKPVVAAVPAKTVVESAKTEIPKEVLVVVKPYYDCSVLQKEGTEPKKIRFEDSKIELPAFIDEKSAKQYAGKDGKPVYPTVEELELILDEAWEMASEGKSNKEVVEMLKKNLGGYYAGHGLKQDQDFYKIVNPYGKLTKIMRRAFSEGYEDYKVSTTRPSYTLFTDSNSDIVMSKENDCSKSAVVAPIEKKEEKKPEIKPELKTVQTQKPAVATTPVVKVPDTKAPAVVTPEVKDEEAQEKNEVEETSGTEETDEEKAPEVNEFDSFNDIEKLVFDKLTAGNLKASKEKDPNTQKSIKAEAREDAKLLIQSRFDDEDWAQKDDKGYWKTEFLNYWNAIVKEIGTRANVAK